MENKKKILFFITKGNFGGAQRYVYDLATNLPKSDFDIVVACGTKEGSLLSQKLQEKNIRVIPLENSEREIGLKKDFLATKEIVNIIKTEKPNIIHLNSSKIGLLGSLAILYLKLTTNYNPKSVFTSHGWAFNEESRSLFSKLIFYLSHYLTVLICDKTIAVSEKTKKDITFLPFTENKIEVIHNGIENFKLMTKKDSSEILKKDKGQITIFTIAELHRNKGLDVALRAIPLLPNEIKEKIQYYIAGSGEEDKNLKSLVENLGIGKLVHFLGFVEDAKKLLSGADVFLFPSRTENLPFALLEAGLAGLPIIATSVGGVSEIIKDMQNGILVHPRNPKEIAEAIIYITEHKDKVKEFGTAIEKTILNFFSLEKMLSETKNIYLEINT